MVLRNSEHDTPLEAGLVCYCFGYSVTDIERDFLENGGHSSILNRIVLEKRSGTCECAEKNPKGR